ncbi:polysaccharide deacetylase family protein [Ruminococcus sp.]|uniref:polysaccharide deacetylase family protein n=1 Tax=Ruminococcus sp. TaxID=41978 RepID=UPI0025FD98AC|nr:polysaccharide deacetylase family protein [Ruminococcus sp.]
MMFISLRLRKSVMILLALVIAAAVVFGFSAQAQENDEKKEGVAVPIIMYHSILKDEARTGEYVITPIELEKDMLWLKNNGYTPVFVNDLIRYVKYDGELPEKPVVLTFDDGTYNYKEYLLPLLKKYDFKATVSIVGSYTDIACEEAQPNPAYSYLDWQDVTELRNSGLVEICNHSYDMHNLGERRGVMQLENETYEKYRKVFLRDTTKLQDLCDEHCGFQPNVYTYPFGINCESSRRLVKNMGFEASLGVEGKMNYIVKGDESCLFDLNRYNRSGMENTNQFMSFLTRD